MRSTAAWHPALLSVLALALGLPGGARAQLTGTGELTGRSLLSVKGCGKDRATLVTMLTVAGDGTWLAQSPDGVISGPHTPRGSSGRKLDLQFDGQTEAGFVAGIVVDVSALCEAAAIVTRAERKAFVLQLNRKQTIVKISLTYRFEGSAAGVSGTAKYRLRAKGPWTAAP